MTIDHAVTIAAADAVIAQGLAVATVTAEGRRVRTVKSVRLETPGEFLTGRLPTYLVRLAVEDRPLLAEKDECA